MGAAMSFAREARVEDHLPVEGPDLVLWLDAALAVDPAESGQKAKTPIARWIDRSRHKHDAEQPLHEQRPTLVAAGAGQRFPFVRFRAGQKQFLAIRDRADLDLSTLTAFVVARVEPRSQSMWLFGKNNFHGPWTGYGIAVEGTSARPWPHLGLGHVGSASNGYFKNGRSLRGEFALVELFHDGQRLDGAVNGLRQRRTVSGRVLPNDRSLLIGASPQVRPAVQFLEGDIAEVLIYRRALSSQEQERTRRYLAAKYAIEMRPADETPEMVVIERGTLPVAIENPSTPRTRTLSTAEADGVLRRDWLFQAGGSPTLQRAANEIRWARELAARLQRSAAALDLSRELAELDRLEGRASVGSGADANPTELYLAVRRVKRRIQLANPALDFDRLVFIDQPYPRGAGWRHQSIHRMGHRAVPGGRLLVLDGLHPGGKLRQLYPPRTGAFWRPEVSYDATRVLFCYKAHDEKAFHLHEIDLDGTDHRQLTHGDYDDIDPIYLPGGRIAFTTTRGNSYVRCGPFIYSYVLARCEADGSSVYLISTNSEPDFVPSMLEDGRVLYSRWEYTDKDEVRIQSLWTTNQDGTGTAVFWGNQSLWPDHLAEPRQIPGSHRVMFVGVGHHDWFSGSVGIVDPAVGTNFPHGLTKVTADLRWAEVTPPPVDPRESERYHASGRFTGYLSPYPLSEDDFLVSARGEGGKFRIYLMDFDGNRELVYEGVYNAWHPTPVRKRVAPPVQPDRVVWPGSGDDRRPNAPGTFHNPDVYQGVPGLARGSVKYLRVIHQEAKTYSTWNKTFRNSGPAVSIVHSESVKRIISIVPVYADGSVYFEAPSGQSLFFQLLDEDYRALHTMRSFTGLLPGEHRGCVGCHEDQGTTPRAGSRVSLAMRAGPSPLRPPPWGDESIGYERFVQPMLDRFCDDCHQGDGEAREVLDLTLRPGLSVFKEPYLTLVGPASWIPGGQQGKPDAAGFGDAAAIPVYSHGGRIMGRDPTTLGTLPPGRYLSRGSRLVELASSGEHYDVRVDALSLRRLIAWVDCNSPFRGAEEIRALDDPDFPGIELLPVRPRLKTAPTVARP